MSIIRRFLIIFACLGMIASSKAEVPALKINRSIKLGGIFSLSGFGAKGGLGEMRAAQLAVEQINATGGVAGRTIELIVEDNQSDLKASANAFYKLVQVNGIDALVGPNWSEFAEIVAPLAERDHIPMITPSGAAATITKNRHYVFSLMQSPIEITKALAEAVLAVPGIKHVFGIVHENTYTSNAWAAAQTIWGDRVTTTEARISGETNQDYRTLLSRGANGANTAVFASILPGQYSALLKARKQVAPQVPVFATDVLYDDGVQAGATEAAESLLTGVVGTDFKMLGSQKFQESYLKRFGEKPLNYGAKAYDAVRLLAEAAVECGSRNFVCIEKVDKQGESGHLKFGIDHVVVEEGSITDTYRFKRNAQDKMDWIVSK